MKVLGIDFGDVRTGIAVSDADGIIAMPLTVIIEKKRAALIDKIAQIAEEQGVGALVVGNPVNMNGTRGERSEQYEKIADLLRERLGLPVTMWDERLSTAHAYSVINMGSTKGKKRRENIDAVAASLILESYLGSLANKM
ncbi:MAG: Holliday junction resolvase RuvX [Oscillospiraceae bacterium]|nr:Holliday junction resolvase RuvX [Oscillospiraceae bacterium]